MQRREQAAADCAQVQDIASRLLKCKVARDRMQLRRLSDQKLRMAAGFGFISLNGKAGIHRVISDLRTKQVVGARIYRDHVAHLQAALRSGFASQSRDKRNTPGASNLHILFMAIERRHRNAR